MLLLFLVSGIAGWRVAMKSFVEMVHFDPHGDYNLIGKHQLSLLKYKVRMVLDKIVDGVEIHKYVTYRHDAPMMEYYFLQDGLCMCWV